MYCMSHRPYVNSCLWGLTRLMGQSLKLWIISFQSQCTPRHSPQLRVLCILFSTPLPWENQSFISFLQRDNCHVLLRCDSFVPRRRLWVKDNVLLFLWCFKVSDIPCCLLTYNALHCLHTYFWAKASFRVWREFSVFNVALQDSNTYTM